MKKILIALLFIWPFSYVLAQDGIYFERGLTWKRAKKNAELSNKYIFVEIIASRSEQCKWMEENVLNSKKVGDFYNKNFVSVKVCMDAAKIDDNKIINEHEKRKWKIKYDIVDFPTYLFFDFNGKIVHRMSGAISDSSFINLGRNSLDSNRQYYTLYNLNREGKLRPDLMPYLIRMSKAIGKIEDAKLMAEGYINDYLFKQSNAFLMRKNNLYFISENLCGTNTLAFNFFVAKRKEINEILGADKAEYAIRFEIAREYFPKKDSILNRESDWDLMEKEVAEKFGPLGMEMIYGKRMSYYLKKKDWVNFGRYYMLYFKLALQRPEYNVNGVSWPVFLNITDPDIINFACIVMEYAIEQWYQNNPVAWDTYANLLYKGGKRIQAIEWEEKAVRLKKGQPDEKLYTDALEKMKNNLKTW